MASPWHTRRSERRRKRNRGKRPERRVQLEMLEPRLLLTSAWQNPFQPVDVNDDGAVTPLDALLVINHLQTQIFQKFTGTPETLETPRYLDVNGDGVSSPIDALMVVHHLNSNPPEGMAQASSIDRSDLVNVDGQTAITFSGIVHNSRTRQSRTNVTVANTSATAIATPLILVIETISDPSVTVVNADGALTPDGKPYFDLTGQVPGTTLEPGKSTATRPLVFNNPNLRRFTLTASVYRQVVSPVAPSVAIEILADPLGRKFIGVGEGLDITVRADGTDPVTVQLDQAASASGSRGRVLFGADRTTSATVTTSGGADNAVKIRVQGDPTRPSAFHGDLDLTASVGGTQVAAERVTVLKMVLDQYVVTLQNDRPVLRTVTSIPATSDLDIEFDFFRSGIQGSIIAPPFSPTSLSLNVFPVGGTKLRTGANGVARFLVQQGPAGEGWSHGAARVVYSPDGSGTVTFKLDGEASDECKDLCECITPESNAPSSGCPTCGGGSSGGGGSPNATGSVSPFAGEATIDTSVMSTSTHSAFYVDTHYRSQSSHLRSIMPDEFGVDWGISYITDRLVADGDNVILVSPTVRTDMFVAKPTAGTYLSPIQSYDQLTVNTAGDFELRSLDGTVKSYVNLVHPEIPGRLVRSEDRSGNFTTFHYAQMDPNSAVAHDEKYVLAFVIDAMGREIRYQYYASTSQIVDGRVLTIPHPAGNMAAWGRLARIVDFKGDMDFDGTAESEDFAGQTNNRTWAFDYDSEANLIATTTPAVTGTPNGNDFPDGKTTRYDYLREADIPVSVTGLDRERLLHNLTKIQAPNEAALDPTNSREIFVYGMDPNDPTNFDRVLSYTVGGTNTHDVPAGGTVSYEYEILATDAMEPNDPHLRTTVTDRNGNVEQYVYSAFDTLLEERELTRGFRTGDPEAYVTRYQYNLDKKPLRVELPDGTVLSYTYDQKNQDRAQQGNLTRSVVHADSARGGDQTSIASKTVYEPIYQQRAASVDPRGLDPSYVPSIPDPSGRTQRERYTTRYFFDYQESDPALVLPLLAAELKTSVSVVQARLDAAGVQLGLGDLNGDGDTTPRIAGNVVRIEEPSVVLPAGSNQAGIEGSQLQPIVTLYRYNRFGKVTSMVDPEGNVTTYVYYPETDPDGDGIATPPPADGRTLDASTGGYLAEEIRDTASAPIRNNRTDPTPMNIRTAYTYDDVGNITSETDGRGIRTDYFVNELNQTVQTTRAAAVPSSGRGDLDEPLSLVPFAYIDRVCYDFNDNVVLSQTEDRGNTSQVDGNPPVGDLPAGIPGAVDPDPIGGPAFVDSVFKYDILDNQIEMLEEVANGVAAEFLRTRYRYDPNENQVLTILPEGNANASVYDERNLLLRSMRGTTTPPSHPTVTLTTHLAPSDPTDYDVRGGLRCDCLSYRYDENGNVIETVDSDDTDLSPDNNNPTLGPGDRTRYIYDGFDRLTSVVDSVGNQTVSQYDPAGNVVRTLRFGPVGGPSPTSDGPDTLPRPASQLGVIQWANLVNDNLLEATETLYDELGRIIQTDRVLFVNTIDTVRTPDVSDGATDIGKGNLTPGDNQVIPGVSGVSIIGRVTRRTEYDRRSRTTFTVEDDEDTYRTDYDGVDRVIKTTDPERNLVETAYDDNHNVIETRETDVSQVAGIADELFLTTYFYDSLDRVQRTVDNIGQTVYNRYDSRGNLIAMADAHGPLIGASIARRAFPDAPLTVNAINDFGNVTRYFYDGINRQTRQEVILTEVPQEVSGASTGGNTAATLSDATATFGDHATPKQLVVITAGTGAGQFREIASNTATQLVVSPVWDTIPDATSEYLVTSGTASGDGIHVGASIFGVKDDPSAPESFTPIPDTGGPDGEPQAGGDGIIRTGSTYDRNSLLSSLVDDNGNITTYLYDNLNRLITETKGLVTTSPFTETFILGDRRVVTPTAATINDPAYIPESLIQNQLDAAKSRIDAIASLFPPLADDVADPPPPPQATTIVYGYSPDDSVLILEDENDTEVFTRYDAINRAIAVRVFRSEGNPATRPPDSHVGDPTFAPDPVNDFDGPHRGQYPAIIGTHKQDYQYDGLSRLTLGTDDNEPADTADDSVITYAYDSLDRVIEETQRIGDLDAKGISSAWRAENLRSGLMYPNDRQLAYTYDALDRLNTVADTGAALPIADYDYIGTYRVLVRAYPQNGTRMTYLDVAGTTDAGYDGFRRPSQLRHLRTDNSLVVGFTHTYDRVNNKTSEGKLHDKTNTEAYTYDSVYRLVRFQRPVDGSIAPLHSEWLLDGVSNWDEVDGANRNHSSFNELLSENASAFTYDDNGNQTSDAFGGQEGNVRLLYEWDFRNRLSQVTRESDSTMIAEYSYDPMNRRKRTVVTNGGSDNEPLLNGTTDLYYDGWQVLEEGDGTASLTQQYVYGIYIDEPLILNRNLDNGSSAIDPTDQRLSYHQNTLYSTFALSDVAGVIVDGYQYDAYGSHVLYESGPNGVVDFGGDDVVTVGGSSHVDCTYMYMGRRLDMETGLYYYRHRYLNSTIGRYLLRDPEGYADGLNTYQFVGSSPTRKGDPLGLDCPGCDGVPNALEGPCVLECCAQHDLCFFQHGCTAKSWIRTGLVTYCRLKLPKFCCPEYNACDRCNVEVVSCIAKCASHPNRDDPARPNFFCAKKGKFISIPGDYPDRGAAEADCCT
jgi:RHS repeat-associated protein